jgi:multidrug efflux pump
MQDLVGRLFREFAVTLACAIGLSMLISLTLTPMMGARFLIPKKKNEDTSSKPHEDGAFFKRLLEQYNRGLIWVFNHQKLTLWIAIGSFIATVLLYFAMPKGLFPTQDTGMIQAMTQASPAVSFQTMAQEQTKLAQTLADDPAVESIASIIGVDGVNTSLNTGRLIIKLKDKKERNQQGATIQTVQKRLLNSSQNQSTMKLFLQPIQDITLEERSSRYAYQFILSTSEPNDLVEWVPRWVQALSQRPEFSGVASDQQNDGLAMMIRVDRDAAARLQVNMNTISQALYNAFGQRLISTIFTQSNLYRVVLVAKSLPSEQSVDSILQSVYITTQTGKQVPLASVAQFEMTQTPLVLARVGQFPAVSVSFALADKTSLGDALAAVREVEQSLIEAGMPSRIGLKFEGALGAFDSSLSNTVWLMLAAIVVMYIVLGVLYESWIHPLTILSTLPSAVVGAFLALFIMQRPLDLMAVIGVILLIGIVKKNAIMMVDFALVAERERGLSAQEAIHQACLLRLRPILMTTFAALLGALPLMLGTGMGSELRQPLGITLVGGLLLSQLMTLFTTPVIYLAFHRWTIKKTAQPT